MGPKIILSGGLAVRGLGGGGKETGAVWARFDREYSRAPFEKAGDEGYEIRFFKGEKSAPKEDIHVGFLPAGPGEGGAFRTVELPASQYAVFEILVAKGYDSGNESMDKWLEENAALYRQRLLDGKKYVLEVYGDRFKGGGKPDSIVEIWIPIEEA